MQNAKDHRTNRKAYWLYQLGGWTALTLYEMGTALFLNPGHLPPRAVAIIEPPLSSVYGLLITHRLYSYMRRRNWLNRLDAKLAMRVGGMILLSGTLLCALHMSSMYVLNGWLQFHLPFTRQIVLRSFGGWMVVMVGWMASCLAIRELRRRRNQELHGLRLELIAQEAQLRSLRAQLNPHFFFNCLNSLREMVHEDPQRAEMMVTQLSDLMRYALQSNQVDLVALGSEVEAVRDYLALESIRFEERLRVKWQIEREALESRVPPMLLQTLVENALKHGIARLPHGGEILITACCRDSEVSLEVINSGRMPHAGKNGGLGLKNAQARLQLLYGQRAELSVKEAEGDRVRATVRLPLERLETVQ